MSIGDRVRLCKHPHVMPHPKPKRFPVTVNNGPGMQIEWNRLAFPHDLLKCLVCGIVGEAAQPFRFRR